MKTHEFTFNCKLFATVRVNASSKAEAEEVLRNALDAASCNAGAWPRALSIGRTEGMTKLIEIDGEELA